MDILTKNYMKKSDNPMKKIQLTFKEKMEFAFISILVRRHFKRSRFVFNDLTAIKSGINEINLKGNPLYTDGRFIYCNSTPLYDKKAKRFSSKLKTGSKVTLHGMNGVFEVGWIVGNSMLIRNTETRNKYSWNVRDIKIISNK